MPKCGNTVGVWILLARQCNSRPSVYYLYHLEQTAHINKLQDLEPVTCKNTIFFVFSFPSCTPIQVSSFNILQSKLPQDKSLQGYHTAMWDEHLYTINNRRMPYAGFLWFLAQILPHKMPRRGFSRNSVMCCSSLSASFSTTFISPSLYSL